MLTGCSRGGTLTVAMSDVNIGGRIRWYLLSDYVKGLAAFWAKTKDSKVLIQGGDTLNTQTAHHRKAGAINDGKILVGPGKTDIPRSLQIRQTNSLNDCDPRS